MKLPFVVLFNLGFVIHWNVSAYSAHALDKDRSEMNMKDFIPYRGSILKDIWIDPLSSTAEKEKEVCDKLFRKALATVNNETARPARHIPESDKAAYLLGDKTTFQSWYIGSDVFNGVRTVNWTKAVIDQYRSHPVSCGQYDKPWCDEILQKYVKYIHQKDVAIIGSQYPWAEAAMFNLQVQNLVTIEYTKIQTDYPHYLTYHPSEVAQAYLQQAWREIDAAFSYSSLEHDGLGRYGDPLNPVADLESIARIRCLLKPGGVFFLGVPVGRDTLAWNAHRIYGKYRLALVSLGWRVLDIYPKTVSITGTPGEFQEPIIVLQKKPSTVDTVDRRRTN